MYRVRVKVRGEGNFVGNGMDFITLEDAKEYGKNLADRWDLVVEWEVRDNDGKLYFWSEEIVR